MRKNSIIVALPVLMLVGCASVPTEPAPEARAALAPTGKLRVGVYLGNPLSVVRDPVSQEMKGAGFELGKELAQRMRVPFEAVVYPSIGAVLDSASSNQWDVSFFQVSPARTKSVDFTAPLVEIELGYLVPQSSALSSSADIDRPGIRIAVSAKGQSDTILTRVLKHAELVRVPGLGPALELLKSGKADAIGNIKPSLFELAGQLPGSRVLEGRFATEHIAMALPKGREAGLAYARKFIQDAKSEGLAKAAVERAGARGAVVAPPE
jgi:polar amino acid transport system substrate-binding protein